MSVRDWGVTGMMPPNDTPSCGFYNQFCQVNPGIRQTQIHLKAFLEKLGFSNVL